MTSQRRNTVKKVRADIYVPEDLFAYFEASLLDPVTGHKRHGMSALVERLLRQERARLIDEYNRLQAQPPQQQEQQHGDQRAGISTSLPTVERAAE